MLCYLRQQAVTEDKCCRLVKTPEFGIVLRVILNYMQRVRVPVYTPSPTIPGICDLVHVFMGRVRIPDSGKKNSQYFQIQTTLRQGFSQHPSYLEVSYGSGKPDRFLVSPQEKNIPSSHPLHVSQSL